MQETLKENRKLMSELAGLKRKLTEARNFAVESLGSEEEEKAMKDSQESEQAQERNLEAAQSVKTAKEHSPEKKHAAHSKEHDSKKHASKESNPRSVLQVEDFSRPSKKSSS
ncbi:unnamed protein product [Polarella glacialis]|uniref:Uncharacterized protein n=1 Tax=Polarella glacialis TaxID=89957 RepID=A0A813LKL4_POLGL|nr:unnamed protein product [Polarella glacialis]